MLGQVPLGSLNSYEAGLAPISFVKVHMRRRASSFSKTEISAIWMKIFSYEHLSPGLRDETFFASSLSQHSGQNGVFFPCLYFHFREVCELDLLIKVTKLLRCFLNSARSIELKFSI